MLPLPPQFLPHTALDGLIEALAERGYQVIGPRVLNGAVVLAPLGEASQLPWGVRDVQAPGSYTLVEGHPERAFQWVNGPSSLKPFLFKQQETLWQSTLGEDGTLSFASVVDAPKQAVIGARPCDIAALVSQDRVFLGGANVDLRYKARREGLFTVVVNCSRSSSLCFCLSVGGSPRASQGFDIAMTEITGGLVVEAGSEVGREVLLCLSHKEASLEQVTSALTGVAEAERTQARRLPSMEEIARVLPNTKDHPEWDRAAERCESCGNCTKLCPTCICHRQTYLPSLDGEGGEQVREWDTCQSEAHSYTSGKSLRAARRERYRMRVTHKFVNLQRQFDVPGCVGCGRCIAFCENGIDMLEHLSIIVSGKDREGIHE